MPRRGICRINRQIASRAHFASRLGRERRNSVTSMCRNRYQKHASVTAILTAKTAIWVLLRFRTVGSAASRLSSDSSLCIRLELLAVNNSHLKAQLETNRAPDSAPKQRCRVREFVRSSCSTRKKQLLKVRPLRKSNADVWHCWISDWHLKRNGARAC